MTYLPYVFVVIVVVGLIAFSARARRRQAQSAVDLAERIAIGSEVMTTSGLYGTIVALDEDEDTVSLSIAVGVEVKWARAALRDVTNLPDRYQRGLSGADEALRPDAESESA